MSRIAYFSLVPKTLEMAANIAIVVIASLLVTSVVRTSMHSRPSSDGRVTKGNHVALDGLTDKDKASRHLVLALSTTCHFCSESTPFYKQLVKVVSQQPNVKLLAVLPQSKDEASDYLQRSGIAIEDVRRANFASLHVEGTPTLILADSAGIAQRVWFGKLSPDQEQEVLTSIRANDITP